MLCYNILHTKICKVYTCIFLFYQCKSYGPAIFFILYHVFLPLSLEFASRSAPVRSDDEMSVKTEYQDFDPAKHNPVFYGKMHERVEADEDVMKELDAATSHPSCAGYTFTDKPPETPPSPPPTPPHKDACEY